MKVRCDDLTRDPKKMLRKPEETEKQWIERLILEARGITVSLTPETADEEAAIQRGIEIMNSFCQHIMIPTSPINEQGYKEYHLSFY